MRRNFGFQLFGIALFVMAFVTGSNPAASSCSQTRPNTAIKFQGLDGRAYDLAGLRGNVVLVSFGATWCTPCSTELHALEELKREYTGRPVKFVWVSIESEEQASNNALKRYAKEQKVTFPVLRDPSKVVFLKFTERVRLPMILFLGKDGRVDAPVHFGMRSPLDFYKADMRARLDKLLAAQTVPER